MKARFILAVFLVVSTYSYTQSQSTEKLTREERKALKQKNLADREIEIEGMINDTAFLMQARRFSAGGQVYGSGTNYSSLSHRSGVELVDPNLFFVEVDKDEVIVQTGLSSEGNLPHMEGITIKGKILDLSIKEFKKFYRVKFYFTSSLGYYRFEGRMTKSGLATIEIESMGTSAKMDFRGDLVDSSTAKVYTGGPFR